LDCRLMCFIVNRLNIHLMLLFLLSIRSIIQDFDCFVNQNIAENGKY
jgi:hypothetical protein